MGACDIQFELDKKATQNEIDKAFKAKRAEDAERNGHQEGYSGDFQTVNKVVFHLHNTFANYNEAAEYCQKVAKKWESVVAVYYVGTPTKSKAQAQFKVKSEKLIQAIDLVRSIPLDKSKPFKTCPNCKSRLNVAHVSGVNCPLCRIDLRPKSVVNRLAKRLAALEELKSITKELIAKENQEFLAKASDKDVKTLVYGWGAC